MTVWLGCLCWKDHYDRYEQLRITIFLEIWLFRNEADLESKSNPLVMEEVVGGPGRCSEGIWTGIC